MNSKIVVFIPSIEGGGVEKNLFLICNYLSRKVDKLKVITISKKFRKKFSKSIEIITYASNFFDKKYYCFFFSSKYLLYNYL